MRVWDAAGTLGLPVLALVTTVSCSLLVIVVLAGEASTADTPIFPAPGNRVTACLLVNNADIEFGTGGAAANRTFRLSFAAGVRARLCPVVGV